MKRPEPSTYPGAPRWVKIFGIVAAAVTAVFITVHLAGRGFRQHGRGGEHHDSGRP